MKKINVLHVVNQMNRGGAETLLMNFLRKIDKNRFKFYFLIFNDAKGDYDDEIRSLGGELISIDGGNSLARFYNLYRFLNKNKGKFDIVHSHLLLNDGFQLTAAKLAGIHTRISHSHSTLYKQHMTIVDKAYEFLLKRVIAFSATQKIACGDLAGKYLFSENSDFTIINNSIDLNKFRNIKKQCENYWDAITSHKGLKIIQVGRLTDLKNHKFSLEIVKKLKDLGHEFTFMIVGKGEEREGILEMIGNLNLTDQVILMDVRSDVAELMAGADVLLMPSKFEGFPMVLVESQAVGLQALVSNAVSDETDLGLDLVKFLGIDKADIWVDEIIQCTKQASFSGNVYEVLRKKGFDLNSNIELLEKFYS